MAIDPGTRLGPYEIVALIGSGGMGQVYRARDTRLGREVAVKVLRPESTLDGERVRRFALEARATGALSHPAVLALFDVGEESGITYVVSELLHGETLRGALRRGPLPLRRALEHAAEIAHGLNAAHEKGIVHRDLKPENLFLTEDGRIKVLDFGLAKLLGDEVGTGASSTGAMVGTTGYMSPEQAGGQADHRSDIFALGAVLYEMLSSRRAFQGASAGETLLAMLRDEPAPLRDDRVPPAVERVVLRCLEKRPQDRFQSARDLAFALEALAGSSSTSQARAAFLLPRLPRPRGAAVAVAAAMLGAGVGVVAMRQPSVPEPTFDRVSFGRGRISTARFAADGQTIVYAAAWEGGPSRLYVKRAEDDDTQVLDLPEADLLSVSRDGQLAVLLGLHRDLPFSVSGTLAVFPLVGGAPRPLLEDVRGADWAPDGHRLAVVREVDGRSVLELRELATEGGQAREPQVLYRNPTGYLSQPRFSPRGDRVAVMTHRARDGSLGGVVVVDLSGQSTVVARGGVDVFKHLVWTPSGKELVYTRSGDFALVAVSLDGTVRELRHFHSNLGLQDLAPDGTMLACDDEMRSSLVCRRPGDAFERDLSWLQITRGMDISPDGRRVLFVEYGGNRNWAGLRETDGSPVVRLGEGEPKAFSPQGDFALTQVSFVPPRLALVPTGVGEVRPLPPNDLESLGFAAFLPGGKQVVFAGAEPGHATRLFVQDVAQGPPRPISPEGLYFPLVAPAPDGRTVAAVGPDRRTMIYPVDGGPGRAVPGLAPNDQPIRYADDGSLYVFHFGEIPAVIRKVDPATGQGPVLWEVGPADRTGVLQCAPRLITPDGRGYGYQYMRMLSRLYVARGIRVGS